MPKHGSEPASALYSNFENALVLEVETEQKLKTHCSLLQNLEAWRAKGISAPTGLLLVGPPGTGKTQIARTLANESGLSLVGATTADIKANFLGQSANRVKQLFERRGPRLRGYCFWMNWIF